MSDINSQQLLNNKYLANGLLKSKIVKNVKTTAGSGDTKQSAGSITAANKNNKTYEINGKKEIEDFNQNDPTGINKWSADKNGALPIGDKKSKESIVEKTNDDDITLGHSVAKKSESQNGGQISTANHFENSEENKSVENFGECIYIQTKNTSTINELGNCHVHEDEHREYKDVSLSETEIKDKENPESSHIEKNISVAENVDLRKSAGKNIDEKTTQNTAQAKTKPTEDKPKGIIEPQPLQKNLDIYNFNGDDIISEGTQIPAIEKPHINEKPTKNLEVKPLVPVNFLKTSKTSVADMTREDLEDLCLQLIVEGVIDRSNLSEFKTKLKTMSSSIEELRKKTMTLSKQNQDLQIVLNMVQEEQKKKSDKAIIPPKITRSVGMQITMSERKLSNQTPRNHINTSNAPNPSARQQLQKCSAQIPEPILSPATSNSPSENTRPSTTQVQNTIVTSFSEKKTSSPHSQLRRVGNSPPVNSVEKRSFSSIQSVTVDLSDDEPPSKQQVTDNNATQHQTPPNHINASNAPNPICVKQQLQKFSAQIPEPILSPANSNLPSENRRPSTTQVQNATDTSYSKVKTYSPHSQLRRVRNSPPVNPVAKRSFISIQSLTVDLSDDEPPSKQQVTDKSATQPQTLPNHANASNAPNPSARQLQKFSAQIPEPILNPATSNLPSENTRPSTTQVQNATVTSYSEVKTSSPHSQLRRVKNSHSNMSEKQKHPDQTPTNHINASNAPNPSVRQQLQKFSAQMPEPVLSPATSNLLSENTRPRITRVQKATDTSYSEVKTSSPHSLLRRVRKSPPVNSVEKRSFSSIQSVTVGLSADEPSSKQQVTDKNATQPPVRLVAQNQVLSAMVQNHEKEPRKVYIDINSQNQAIRPGQTIKFKSVPPGADPQPSNASPLSTIASKGQVKTPRFSGNHKHPAPLPNVAKQDQPPNWKRLPPAPDLSISKVENGIVISWDIEEYQEDSYEEIVSYQLYSYQETSSPPSTLLWKEIGKVKALPLPMACTLTQFMSGHTYYFAVRAIDVRSRIGPFSLPNSILLLNK